MLLSYGCLLYAASSSYISFQNSNWEANEVVNSGGGFDNDDDDWDGGFVGNGSMGGGSNDKNGFGHQSYKHAEFEAMGELPAPSAAKFSNSAHSNATADPIEMQRQESISELIGTEENYMVDMNIVKEVNQPSLLQECCVKFG